MMSNIAIAVTYLRNLQSMENWILSRENSFSEFFLSFIDNNEIQASHEYNVTRICRKPFFPFKRGQWVRSNYKSKWIGKIDQNNFNLYSKRISWIKDFDQSNTYYSVSVIFGKREKFVRKPFSKTMKLKYLDIIDDENFLKELEERVKWKL